MNVELSGLFYSLSLSLIDTGPFTVDSLTKVGPVPNWTLLLVSSKSLRAVSQPEQWNGE